MRIPCALAATAAPAHAPAPPGGRIQDLRLVAIGNRDGVMVGYLLQADGKVLEVPREGP